MNKEFIPYEQALALKELGFDEPCFCYYDPNGKFHIVGNPLNYNFKSDIPEPFKLKNPKPKDISAPTFSQAFRWFREKYVLLGFIEPANGYEDKSLFAFYICDDEQNIVDDSHSYSKDSSLHFKTYEEAELACLIKLIELVKKNTNE